MSVRMRLLIPLIALLLITACSLSKAEAEEIALEEFKRQNGRVADLIAGRIDPQADPVKAVQADQMRNLILAQNERAEVLKSVQEENRWRVVITIPTEDAVPTMDVFVYEDGRVVIPAVDEMLAAIAAS